MVAGWAFDWRPFAQSSPPAGGVVYTRANMQKFAADLYRWLMQQEHRTISLLGWSMGAYAVADFAANHPAMVNRLILVSARSRYGPQEIDPVRARLRRRRRAFLGKFYRDCFSAGEGAMYRWFRSTLLQDYLEQMTLTRLLRGLDWLSTVRLDSDRLRSCRDLVLVHGTADRITPLKEAQQFARALPGAKTVWLKDAGHLPFLRSDFAEQVYGTSELD
jgi:pimeloyl-ACP methyl ester carboxylesterase